jgi:arginase
VPRVALIGAASSVGARQVGQEQTPGLFRRVGLIAALREAGLEVVDLGDTAPAAFRPDRANRSRQNLPFVVAVARQVAERVALALEHDAFPLVVGGDCTVTLGVLSGLARSYKDLGLVYFDGDVDLHTPATTESGIFDGMGMAHIVGEGDPDLSGLGPIHPLVPAERILLFGFAERWIDSAERTRLRQHAFIHFPLEDILAAPVGAAVQARAALEEAAGSYLLHFDVDVVDYLDLPVADVPHFNGLALDAALACVDVFLAGHVAAFVLTEFNALRDPDGTFTDAFVGRLARLVARAAHAR